MRKSALCLVFFVAVALNCWPGWAADHVPVQARLLRSLDAGRVKFGDYVLAKVVSKWQSPECVLRKGAILKGRVVGQTAFSKTTRMSEIALLFDSGECGGPLLRPLPLIVAAVMAGNPRLEPSMYESQPLSDAVGLSLNGGTRSLTVAASTVFDEPYLYRGPTTIQPGEVDGIKGVQLKVGSGPEGSSVLTASGHNVRLDSGSFLVLVPNLNAPAPSVASGAPASAIPSVPVSEATTPEVVEQTDESEACSPQQCSLALSYSDNRDRSAAWATLPVKELGYSRPQHDIYAFDYDSAISYLGEKQLVFTFNPHVLIPRTAAEGKLDRLRVIRAVLIDLQTKKVVKTVDWKVQDERQYLWTNEGGRILVHVGRELRLYGPDLKLEQRFSLGGPLAFVRISPSSRYFAVGVIRERHSEFVHRELEEAEGREPEEDVEVKVLDATLQTLAAVVRSSRIEAPALSDYGEVRIRHKSRNRWEIIEDSWDKQERVVTAVNSTCRPEATTFSPNLMFLIGCDRQVDGRWYRVLRPDGKPVLKGWSSSEELERRVAGVAGVSSFSIGIAEASKSLTPGAPFRPADLKSEHIAVYRSDNGERTFSITLHSPVPTVQTFAMSPDGSQLAILQPDELALYRIPVSGGR